MTVSPESAFQFVLDHNHTFQTQKCVFFMSYQQEGIVTSDFSSDPFSNTVATEIFRFKI